LDGLSSTRTQPNKDEAPNLADYYSGHKHNFILDNDKPEFGTIRLNADGGIDAAELDRFGVEPLPITNEGDEQLQGGFGFIGYDGLEYAANGGMSARRQAIVAELQARDIRRPTGHSLLGGVWINCDWLHQE
jgi:hypothetical protein